MINEEYYKNTLTIFKKDRKFLKSIILEPVFMLLIFFVFPCVSDISAHIRNQQGFGEVGKKIVEMLDDIKYLKVTETEEDEIDSDIASDRIKLAIVIDEKTSVRIESGESARNKNCM